MPYYVQPVHASVLGFLTLHNIQYCHTTGPRIGHTINSLASYGMGIECTIPWYHWYVPWYNVMSQLSDVPRVRIVIPGTYYVRTIGIAILSVAPECS